MSSMYLSAVVSTKVPESPFCQVGGGFSKSERGSRIVMYISRELFVER